MENADLNSSHSSAKWKHNKIYPSVSEVSVVTPTSSRPVTPVFIGASASKAKLPTLSVEEATGEVVVSGELEVRDP